MVTTRERGCRRFYRTGSAEADQDGVCGRPRCTERRPGVRFEERLGPLSAGQGYRRPRRALHRNDGSETRHAEDVISSGDKVVARTRVTGTSTGTLMGMPPRGKSVNVQVIDILRFGDDGLVREHWGVMDMMSMMQQLGVAAQGPPG